MSKNSVQDAMADVIKLFAAKLITWSIKLQLLDLPDTSTLVKHLRVRLKPLKWVLLAGCHWVGEYPYVWVLRAFLEDVKIG